MCAYVCVDYTGGAMYIWLCLCSETAGLCDASLCVLKAGGCV